MSATGTWEESRAMLSKRCRLGVATLNGKIYACGGYDGSSFLKTVEVFDPVTKKWAQVKKINTTYGNPSKRWFAEPVTN